VGKRLKRKEKIKLKKIKYIHEERRFTLRRFYKDYERLLEEKHELNSDI
jgi:hypothetical protein